MSFLSVSLSCCCACSPSWFPPSSPSSLGSAWRFVPSSSYSSTSSLASWAPSSTVSGTSCSGSTGPGPWLVEAVSSGSAPWCRRSTWRSNNHIRQTWVWLTAPSLSVVWIPPAQKHDELVVTVEIWTCFLSTTDIYNLVHIQRSTLESGVDRWAPDVKQSLMITVF